MRSTFFAATLAALLTISTLGVDPTFANASPTSQQEEMQVQRGHSAAGAPDQATLPRRQAPCARGTASVAELEGHEILETGDFPCDRVDLLSFLTVDEMGGGFAVGEGRGSDVWGWTDPETGRDYVLAGLEVGTSFIDITDPRRPVYLAHLPTSASNDLIWRDIKVYDDHAFIVAESADHGMQVLDLTTLRDLDPEDAPHTIEADAHYDGFQRAHNIVINEDSGFAFAVDQRDDAEECGRGMHMIDIREPTEPSFAGCYEETRVHDAQCMIYDGVDDDYVGREICITSTGGGQSVGIVDVTDKENPVTVSLTGYPNAGFSHQGWLLEDGRYYLHNTESTTRTPQGIDIFDLEDLEAPEHIGSFENPAQSTQHNLYQADDGYVYQSNYKSGLRVYDVSDVADGELEEVAHFDVFPPDDEPGFSYGSWSNYPMFESRVIAVHGYQGLWLVKPRLGASPGQD